MQEGGDMIAEEAVNIKEAKLDINGFELFIGVLFFS